MVSSTKLPAPDLNWEVMEGGEESPEDTASASVNSGMPLLPNMFSP